MTATTLVSGVPGTAVAAEAHRLHVFVSCGPWVLALPTASVERLLLAEEGGLSPRDAEPDAPAHVGVLTSGRAAYSAWDLGLLLGLPAQSEAWVLLRVPRPQGPLALALRSGACLSTGLLPPSSRAPLPRTIARARVGVLSAAFPAPTTSRAQPGAAAIGLALELTQLWTEAELAVAQDALRMAGKGQQ